MIVDWQLAFTSLPFILKGLGITFLVPTISFFFGSFLGLILTEIQATQSKILSFLARSYISILRGIPSLVWLFLLYFGLPFMGIQLSPFSASIIAFSTMSAAFLAEYFRAAISAVPVDQWDAGYSLGLNHWQVYLKVILPQAFKIVTPSLFNVYIDLFKGSSLVAMITLKDIFQRAKIIGGREHDYITMYITVAAVYWVCCFLIAKIQLITENYFSPDDPKQKDAIGTNQAVI